MEEVWLRRICPSICLRLLVVCNPFAARFIIKENVLKVGSPVSLFPAAAAAILSKCGLKSKYNAFSFRRGDTRGVAKDS